MVTPSAILNWISFAKWVTFPGGQEGRPIESPCIENSSLIGTDIIIMYNVTVSGGGPWGADYDIEYSYNDPDGTVVRGTGIDNCVKPGTFTWAFARIKLYKAGTYTNLKGVISNVRAC